MTTLQKKTVLITGCSTGGIGWAMAKNFHERGYYIFATIRDPAKAADLSDLKNVEILELDVTIPKSIEQCKNIVTKRTGGKLDVLVNNAGIEFCAPLLDTDITEAKKLYDTNVWGPLLMVQAFAPLLIEAKGVICNQSSIDAALSMVWAGKLTIKALAIIFKTISEKLTRWHLGIFSSSKAAEARISETMRLELEPLGVRVLTAMNGSADTPMFGKPGGRMNLPESSHYYNVQEAAYKERMDHQKQASKVEVLAEMLVKDIVGGAKGIVWHGAFSALTRFITWGFPTWLVDKLVNGERGVKHVKQIK